MPINSVQCSDVPAIQGGISHLLTLGKCLIPRYVPGLGGGGGGWFQLTEALH